MVALKLYDKAKVIEAQRQRSIQREIKILKKMSNPYIIKVYETLETNKYIAIVMEYVKGYNLSTYLKRKNSGKLTEDEAKVIFRQIVNGISYCHKYSVAHRDIKLDNILVNEYGGVKIIDFGFSTCIPNNKKVKMFCGTPSYMAPEIILRTSYSGPPADIWALGILLYSILSASFPFQATNNKELYEKIIAGRFDYPPNFSSSLRLLMSNMLQVDPMKRITAEGILMSEWLNDIPKRSHSKPKTLVKINTEHSFSKALKEIDNHIGGRGEERKEMLKVYNRVRHRTTSQFTKGTIWNCN